MRRNRKAVALALACAMLVIGSVAVPTPVSAKSATTVVADGISSPRGLALDPFGQPLIAQGAFGPPGPVLVHILRGPDRGNTIEVNMESFGLIDVGLSPTDGAGWGIISDTGVLARLDPVTGVVDDVLDMHVYQAGDPDPFDLEGLPEESNPFGLGFLPNGDALVADAAGNDLVRVRADGRALTVARFDTEMISTDHIPPEEGLPPEIPSEAVPTTVTIGPDGFIYVGELQGFPFRDGTSDIWRIAPNARNAVCSKVIADPNCTLYDSGYTAIQDITFGPTGTLYVYELAVGGVFAFEEGFMSGVFPPARLLQVEGATRTELAAGELSEPGGVIVAGNGQVYVTDGVFTAGRLVRINT